MRRVVGALAAAVLAAVVLSACGSSGLAPVSAPHVKMHGPGSIVFVAGGPSTGFGVDNTDLLAATPSGRVHDLTSSAAAENDAAWSADGSRVVFVRQSTTGQKNGAVTSQAGIYAWSLGHGAPRRIASCSTYCSDNEFAWSPDDRQLAFVSYSGPTIEVMNADGSGVHVVCDPERCGDSLDGPVWSPDGRKLAFSNGGMGPIGPIDLPSSIWIANADGSGVERLTQPNCTTFADERVHDCARDTAPAWSPDGRLIAFSRWRLDPFPLATGPTGLDGPTGTTKQSGPTRSHRPITTSLEVMRADGSHLRSIYDCSAEYCDQTLPPAWSPDGKAIAYAPSAGRTDPSSFRITTLAGKTTTIRTCSDSRCLYPEELTWSPSGGQLAFFAGGSPSAPDVWVIGRDGGGMHRVAFGAQCYCLAWVGHVSLSGAKAAAGASAAGHLDLSGTIAYDDPSGGPDSQLHFLSLGTGSHARQVAPSPGLEPAWSPDGRQIAFGAVRATPNTNIYVSDRNGKNVRVLTRFHGGATQPAWSPDGRTIAFTLDNGIGLVSAAGGHVRSLTSDGAEPSWSPNGGELVFDRYLRGENEALFTIRPDGRGLRRLTNLPGEQRSPTWSPDGTEIAFEWETPAGEGLYLVRPDGTHLRRVTTATVPQGKPAWSPDSRYLLVMDQQGAVAATRVSVIDVKSGRVSTVATLPGEAADPAWSAR